VHDESWDMARHIRNGSEPVEREVKSAYCNVRCGSRSFGCEGMLGVRVGVGVVREREKESYGVKECGG
jgi:hypothetical protein